MLRRTKNVVILEKFPIISRKADHISTLKGALAAQNNRGPGFDTIRLVAASMVVLHHSLGVQMDIVKDDWLYQFSGGYATIGSMAVSVFFAISGFMVSAGLVNDRDVLGFLSRRFMRIMPLLVVVVAVTVLVVGPLLTTLPLADYFAQTQTWAYFKNVTTLLEPSLPGVATGADNNTINGSLWTLHYEVICYILLALSVSLLRYRYVFALLWTTWQVAAAADIGLDQFGSRFAELTFLFGYFGGGVVVFLFADRLPWSKPLLAIATICLAAALYVAPPLVPIITTYLVVGLGLLHWPWSNLLAKADLSYGVYLTHAVWLTILLALFDIQSALVLFAVGFALSMLTALVTWTFIERPSLAHKQLPADIVRKLVRSVVPVVIDRRGSGQ